ncbi:MAG: hypothetical protein IPP88_16475 [Betaproteobacteria bacterium]|nr:hypothetical protein [Betaproteobacteria bacterium]
MPCPLGWHLYSFLRPARLCVVRERPEAWAINVVGDHLAGMGRMSHHANRARTRGPRQTRCLIKISAQYRTEMQAPLAACDTLPPHIGGRFAGRVLWGSDWPHTWFAEKPRGNATAYGELLTPVARVSG